MASFFEKLPTRMASRRSCRARAFAANRRNGHFSKRSLGSQRHHFFFCCCRRRCFFADFTLVFFSSSLALPPSGRRRGADSANREGSPSFRRSFLLPTFSSVVVPVPGPSDKAAVSSVRPPPSPPRLSLLFFVGCILRTWPSAIRTLL